MKSFITSILFLISAAAGIQAQTHYSCDFESAAENAQWTLNPTGYAVPPNFANKWYIGTGIHNGGKQSMYISADGGATPGYTAGSMMIAYREIQLDAGNYELSFDWMGGGVGGSDVVHAAWVPLTERTNSSETPSRPDFMDQYGLTPDDQQNDTLCSSWWKTSVFRFTSDGEPRKLVFAWTNTQNTSTAWGACIDNINIIPEGTCEPPENLQLTSSGSSVIFSWTGSGTLYEAKYYSPKDDRWVFSSQLTETSITFDHMSEGMHDFYVRTVCGINASHWVKASLLVYLPELRCIDYLTLTDQNCWTGNVANLGRGIQRKEDYGYDRKESRHTIHMVQNEFDARTENKLRTIPEGEIASVRLGNWDIGGGAEQIEYNYTVDVNDGAVLILKYAVIMSEPPNNPHEEKTQASFELKIYSGNTPLECGSAKFIASFDTQDRTWHYESGGVWWKEWTTVGINLKEYDGETLRIVLNTLDCGAGGHYGYAYFTLGCSDGKMDGIACGDIPTTYFRAPDGFNYRWYLPEKPEEILSSSQQLNNIAPDDTLTYHCDLIFPSNPNCYFTLTACAIPRHPVAVGSYTASVKNCSNVVEFKNESYIMLVNQITTDSTHTPLPCETARWDFGDGITSTEYSPSHVFPEEGGFYQVRMTVGINNEMCTSDILFSINLPDLRAKRDTIPGYGCLGEPYPLPNGQLVWNDGCYPDTIKTVNGCDSIIKVYKLSFGNQTNIELTDTICSFELPYHFNGELLTKSDTYIARHPNVYGCDSTTTLHLHVIETVEVELAESNFEICSGETAVELNYQTNSGNISLYNILFDEQTKQALRLDDISGTASTPLTIPLPEDALPGYYGGELVFYDENCGNDTLPFYITINYPESIISQRWNDVLFIKNTQHNGGYEFSAYQWYKDDAEIEGGTASYLKADDALDTNASYRVALTRADDNVTAFTCPFIPRMLEEVSLTLASSTSTDGESFKLNSPAAGKASIYNISGLLLAEQNIIKGQNGIKPPETSGYYILQIQLENQQSKVYHINVVR